MVRLHMIVEGNTEETFVKMQLAPHLGGFNVFTDVRKVETGRGRQSGRIFRGGMTTYAKARRDLKSWMKQDRNPDAFFTTMFDLYGLPRDFPGQAETRKPADPYSRVADLEKAFAEDIRDPRFIPYLQLHEFEALLLSDPGHFKIGFAHRARAIERLILLSAEHDSPELIDEGQDTSPSKRIIKQIPEYESSKASAGPGVARRIGLPAIRARCPHFDSWLAKLEALRQ